MDINYIELHDQLLDRLEELEKQAGITEQMEYASAPLSGMFDDPTLPPGEFEAEQYDQQRHRTRKVYFSVNDEVLRKSLILTQIEAEEALQNFFLSDVHRLQKDLAEANRNINKLPWFTTALQAAMISVIGYFLFEYVGLVVGAVIGLVLSQQTIYNAKYRKESSRKSLEHEIESAKRDHKEILARPAYFSPLEGDSGYPAEIHNS